MSDKLAKAPPALDLTKVEVGVISKANPSPGILRLARIVVQQTPEVSAIFTEAKEQRHPASWIQERLQPELDKFFPNEAEAVKEVSTFLADEYTQIGDSLLLISAETGRALARLTDEDFYTPAPVPRESGNMVQPGARIRPDIEGTIVQWVFDRSQEREHFTKLLERIPQTQLLRDEGDSRMLFTTRAGRRLLATQIETALPDLLKGSSGVARAFLDFFPMGKPERLGFEAIQVRPLNAYRAPLQDPTARNLKYDIRGSVLSGTSTAWVRAVAEAVLDDAFKARRGRSASLDEAFEGRSSGLWVASANVATALRRRGVLSRFLVTHPRVDEYALYLTETAGHLELKSDGFWCRSREVHDRWTLEAEMDGTLWIDWSKVTVFALSGVALSGASIER